MAIPGNLGIPRVGFPRRGRETVFPSASPDPMVPNWSSPPSLAVGSSSPTGYSWGLLRLRTRAIGAGPSSSMPPATPTWPLNITGVQDCLRGPLAPSGRLGPLGGRDGGLG